MLVDILMQLYLDIKQRRLFYNCIP